MPSLQEFKSSFKTDVARPARFDIEMPIPLKLLAFRNISRKLSLRCESAELPGKTIATTDRKVYGPIEKQPYLTTFNDLTFTFIVSDDMSEKRLFDAWMNLINPKTTFNLNYKSDYVTNVTINQYNVKNDLSYSATLIDAFPVSVNQLDLDWSNETSHHKLAVTFAYYTWETNTLQSFGQDLIDAGVSAGVDAATEALSSFAGSSSFNPLTLDTGGAIYKMEAIARGFTIGSSEAPSTLG